MMGIASRPKGLLSRSEAATCIMSHGGSRVINKLALESILGAGTKPKTITWYWAVLGGRDPLVTG